MLQAIIVNLHNIIVQNEADEINIAKNAMKDSTFGDISLPLFGQICMCV
jgi:hypothetical protein